MELNQIKTIIRSAGVVGAGGAGFPTFAKLATGADTLIVNAVECEPLLYTDYTLMQHRLPQVLEALGQVLQAAEIGRCLLALKQSKAKELHLVDGQELAPSIYVKQVPDVYPMGDEISLIYEATGRLVPPGQLPLSVGVIVINLETAYNVYRALQENAPVTEKWVTIGGHVKESFVVRVPVGLSIAQLFERLGVSVPDNHVVLDGGPSMGAMIDYRTAVITKTTKGLLILPEDIPAVVTKKRTARVQFTLATSVCCQCTRCTDMCPRALLGYPLEPHRHVRVESSVAEVLPEVVLPATLCCSCGICEIAACCQSISPRAVIAAHRAELMKHRMKYTAVPGVEYKVNEYREDRKLPTERWKSLLGVSQYDVHPTYIEEKLTFDKVVIKMNQHSGPASIPAVVGGETVRQGQEIATAATGFSVPQHASIAGVVTKVDHNEIVIERV